jgi:hypothetical protein
MGTHWLGSPRLDVHSFTIKKKNCAASLPSHSSEVELLMKYASIPWVRTALTTFASRKNTGFFARILDSLHHSRRLQAQRFLRTHRHLIDGGRDSRFKPNAGGGDNGDR